MMRYRVVRDIGSADYAVGATIAGDALDPRRLRLLVEQRRIEPIETPPSELAAAQAARLEDLERQVAELTAKNAALEAAQAPPDLGKLKADELKALATERGIEGAANMTKAELVAALSAPGAGEEAPNA